MNTPTQMIVGGLIRFSQGLIAASPTLLVGLLIASILRYYLGRDGTKRLFWWRHVEKPAAIVADRNALARLFRSVCCQS